MAVRRDALRKQAREGLCYGVWVTLGTALGLGLLLSSIRYTGEKSVPMLVALASALELAGCAWLRLLGSSSQNYSGHRGKIGGPLIASITSVVLSILFFHILAVLFGAPLFEDSHQTLWFGVHMTVVTILPLILAGGHTSLGALQRTIVDQKFCEVPLDWIQRWGSRAALLGAWLGAIALVLDWDRPWQQWPTPCIVGSLLLRGPGLVVASCILARQ
uniref:Putative ethanolamine-p-transferase gpi11/pig-f n=1 Tax=Amblyomma sculptum TaxID=1581419 RepID=A0A1E1XLS6_AMBSC